MDNEQSIGNVYKYEKCKFEEAFLVLKPSKILPIVTEKSRICRMTEKSEAYGSSDFDGNTILVGRDNEYVFISGFEIIKIQ